MTSSPRGRPRSAGSSPPEHGTALEPAPKPKPASPAVLKQIRLSSRRRFAEMFMPVESVFGERRMSTVSLPVCSTGGRHERCVLENPSISRKMGYPIFNPLTRMRASRR